MLANKLMSALTEGTEDKLYVDDVFSTYLYTGNGSTQTINNGIDLAGAGGLVWTKRRNSTSSGHNLVSTGLTPGYRLQTNTMATQSHLGNGVTGFTSTGYTIGAHDEVNSAPDIYASWTFRKAPKFFDVVIYTGNGVAGRQIPHNLGVAPGFFVTKTLSSGTTENDWRTYHRSRPGRYATLNTTNGDYADDGTLYGNGSSPVAPTASHFTVGKWVNINGVQYVAYLWAHDPSDDGIIQCGRYTESTNLEVSLGWEPQWILHKPNVGGTAWAIIDTTRGWIADGGTTRLWPNLSNAEVVDTVARIAPTPTGFRNIGGFAGAGTENLYVAIRRPNKPPKSGTEVFTPITYTGTGGATVIGSSFAPSDVIFGNRHRATLDDWWCASRLIGDSKSLVFNTSSSEITSGYYWGRLQNGVQPDALTRSYSGEPYVANLFRRAPGFFDVVCYTGTGVARTVNHNLGVAPELMIVKSRTIAATWAVYHKDVGTNAWLVLNTTESASAWTGSAAWGGVPPALNVFTLGSAANIVNNTTSTYVAYLFASLPGISKVGSYNGNGSSQTIDCGFTTGARFILVKRTDSTGDWYVWDTARGIVSANDPHLSLNTTATEVTTDDSVDPDASGFIVNQNTATKINVSGGQYIFLAIA